MSGISNSGQPRLITGETGETGETGAFDRRKGWFWVRGGAGQSRDQSTFTAPAPSGWLQRDPYTVKMLVSDQTFEFPEGGWDPVLRGAYFASIFASEPNWQTDTSPNTVVPTSDADIKRELATLWHYKLREREARSREIDEQADDFSAYFGLATASSRESRPATWALLITALQIGGLVATYHKARFKRRRPVEIWPAIAPSIATPGHPSFPSGHALQALLVAAFLEKAVPGLGPICSHVAKRIAENREVAGVHWPSDTCASIQITEKVMIIVDRMLRRDWAKQPKEGSPKDVSPMGDFRRLFRAAKYEWPAGISTQAGPEIPFDPKNPCFYSDLLKATKEEAEKQEAAKREVEKQEAY